VSDVRFLVDVNSPTIELGLDQIWPDGDAPENPTAADVIAQMQQEGSVRDCIFEWSLHEFMSIAVRRLGSPLDSEEWRR